MTLSRFAAPEHLRQACRDESFTTDTSGHCPGYKQANMVILPQKQADDFEKWCHIEYPNSRGCPILERLPAGQFLSSVLASGSDVRTDLPKYRVWKEGKMIDECNNVRHLWRDDLVTFFFGCSFSFEQALQKAGVPVRNIEQNKNVSMYKTNIMCKDYGQFTNVPLVVSMRPVPRELVPLAYKVTARFTDTHGAPVHHGDPKAIGIESLSDVDFGDAVELKEGDVPVFWACGVTSTMAALQSDADIVITHAPGHMFVTDCLDDELEDN